MDKKQLIIGISAIALIAILVSATLWLYQGSLTPAKKSVFNKLPLPAVLVGMETISAKTLFNRLDTAEQVLNNSGQQLNDEIQEAVLTQLIDSKLVAKVASDNGIVVSEAQVQQEYEDVLRQYSNNDPAAFERELQQAYGMSIEQFKNEIVREEVVKIELSKWFNKQENLNETAYKKIQELMGLLESGQSFEQVATEYTQDEATRDFAGDSGFVVIKDLLPEFQEVVKTAELNKPVVVASRFGIHIVIISDKEADPETGEERYNLKQIFVQPEDFQTWFKTQTEQIKVTRLLNLN